MVFEADDHSAIGAAAAWVAGLHPEHIRREGLSELSLLELATRWPDHMSEAMGERFRVPEYIDAAGRCALAIVQRHNRDMSSPAIAEAEGNSEAIAEPEPSLAPVSTMATEQHGAA